MVYPLTLFEPELATYKNVPSPFTTAAPGVVPVATGGFNSVNAPAESNENWETVLSVELVMKRKLVAGEIANPPGLVPRITVLDRVRVVPDTVNTAKLL